MAIFNGWTIVTLPTDPPAPASIDFTLQDLVASVDNPFTGQQQFQDWQALFIEWSVSMPPLSRTQAPHGSRFSLSTRGSLNVFPMGDPLAATPRGSVSGTSLVNGGSQTGYTLATKGWTAFASGVLLPGDWLQIGYRLYRNLILPRKGDGQNSIRFLS